uniref:Uncharacterized protein n=1 Tax=Euplotes harpa TaxID=151035 RepID=A0A7S3NEZ9_9SPIT|mmetsp:Transcript_43188/g.50655  ORF Transcript_43188/g.50655 Transcript_43188/m.50655 type:complete len:161 (+) Transcript_43188:646-1128(+)
MWKKILRDVREFFRILFRHRFHHLEFKDREGAISCAQHLLDELGIYHSERLMEDYNIFCFMHQTHRYTASKLFIISNANRKFSPFEILENYNENNLKVFLKHPVCSRMFYFVFANFGQHYHSLVKAEYRGQVLTMISCMMNCFQKMRQHSHVSRVDFWLE